MTTGVPTGIRGKSSRMSWSARATHPQVRPVVEPLPWMKTSPPSGVFQGGQPPARTLSTISRCCRRVMSPVSSPLAASAGFGDLRPRERTSWLCGFFMQTKEVPSGVARSPWRFLGGTGFSPRPTRQVFRSLSPEKTRSSCRALRTTRRGFPIEAGRGSAGVAAAQPERPRAITTPAVAGPHTSIEATICGIFDLRSRVGDEPAARVDSWQNGSEGIPCPLLVLLASVRNRAAEPWVAEVSCSPDGNFRGVPGPAPNGKLRANAASRLTP